MQSMIASPLIEPDVRISLIRLSRKLSLQGNARMRAHLAKQPS